MERALGIHSISAVLRPSQFQYESDWVLFEPGDNFLRCGLKLGELIRTAAKEYDIIHYNFGRPMIYSGRRQNWPSSPAAFIWLARMCCVLFEFADVALLKRLGKGIVVTYQGSDARQGDYCLENHDITFAAEVYAPETDAHKRRQIAKFSRYADRVYALNPDLLSVLPPEAQFLPYASVDPRQWTPLYPAPRARPLVMHAPSKRAVKGTRFLLEAVERLQQESVACDLELIENLPHAEARQRYEKADLVVDQLLAGWYGGFAVEAMALGKPVITYLREGDLHVVPQDMRAELPVIDATPATIYDVLKEWLTIRRHHLPDRGRAGRAYVEHWHDARAIAARLIADYEAILCEKEFDMQSPPPPPPPARAAVLCFSPLHLDARVQRQIRALTSICDVTAIGWSDPGIEGVRFVDVSERPPSILRKAYLAGLLKTGRFESVYRSRESVQRTSEALNGHNFTLIVANDIEALPVALVSQGKANVLFDAHEYAPRQHDGWFLWRFFMQQYKEHLCRTSIPQVDAMTTVGPTIAAEYARAFGAQPAVVLNAPYHRKSPYAPRSGSAIRMVHHGVLSRRRRPEIMIDAMAKLDNRFRLDFMLVHNSPRYLASLKKRASSDRRIAFVPPVAPSDIVERLSGYDIGLFSLPPYSFNARHALPNKFFDFIQARLCVAIGPSPEMQRVVRQYECGVVASDFTAAALAERLSALDRRKVEEYRRAADAAAADLCYERSAEVLLDSARRLLGVDKNAQATRENALPSG